VKRITRCIKFQFQKVKLKVSFCVSEIRLTTVVDTGSAYADDVNIVGENIDTVMNIGFSKHLVSEGFLD
jgi:hypothetical protein